MAPTKAVDNILDAERSTGWCTHDPALLPTSCRAIPCARRRCVALILFHRRPRRHFRFAHGFASVPPTRENETQDPRQVISHKTCAPLDLCAVWTLLCGLARVWGGDPPIFVYRMRLWIRVRLVGLLLRRSLSSVCSSILRCASPY